MKTSAIRLTCFLATLRARRHCLAAILICSAGFDSQLATLHAQGSSINSFTYQGRLNDASGPANGLYDFSFALFPASTGGSQIGTTSTRSFLPVTNGLFTVPLEFLDANSFSGADRWLEIAVRPSGVGTNLTLSPRQQITTAPYAIKAREAANLSGTLPLAQLPAGVVTNNSSGVLLAGSFTGNGAGLSNVNAAALGGLSSAGFWKTNGNAGANPTNGAFLGTTDNLPVELKVNGERVLRLEPIAQGVISSLSAPNVVGGWAGNQVANGAIGATVWGGGFGFIEDYGNIVGADFGTVSGGRQNTAGGAEATVAGGRANSASGGNATISGGYVNTAMGSHATVGGGTGNTAGGDTSTVSGGAQNTIQTNAADTTIGGGANNTVSSNSWRGTVGGGFVNTVGAPEGTVAGGAFNSALGFSATIGGGGGNAASGEWSTIAGGRDNVVTNADYAAIGGGVQNTIRTNSPFSTIGGGALNIVHSNAYRGTVGGGWGNTIGAAEGTVAGGAFNSALAVSATIGGGGGNAASGEWSTIAGGRDNQLNTAPYATIGGGVQNTIQSNGFAATIPGGWLNSAADFAFAAGRRAKANHTGAFVWADSTDADFASSGINQFLIRAAGGVGINNNNPNGAALAVGGNVNVEGIISVNGLSAASATTPEVITPKIGTAGNVPLELFVNGQRGLRIEPTATSKTVNVIGGSDYNSVGAGVVGATIGGGGSDNAGGLLEANQVGADFGTVSGGNQNTIQFNADAAAIGGGVFNTIEGDAQGANIGGGFGNRIQYNAQFGTIGGGLNNTIQTNAGYATIGGGRDNKASGLDATVPGGHANTASGNYSTAMGRNTTASNDDATAMGLGCIASGWDSVAMGTYTVAGGHYSLAAGHYARATNQGTFVWADSTSATPFTSTANNQFLLRASGGVGINKNNPATALDVNGTVTATSFSGNGAGLTGLTSAQLTGTILDARLSANVALRGGGNAFTGNQTVTGGNVGIGSVNPQATLHVYSANNPTVLRLQSSAQPGAGRIEFLSDPQGSGNEWRPGFIQSTDNGGFLGGLAFFVNGAGVGNKFGEVETMRVVNGAVGIGTSTPVSALQVVGTVTATAFNPISDRNAKENFALVSPREVLEKVAALPISRWNFKGDTATPHVGPMAQDFYAAFGTGTDERHIATVDADGVALAAIQGLNQKVEETRAENAELKRELSKIKQLLLKLSDQKD